MNSAPQRRNHWPWNIFTYMEGGGGDRGLQFSGIASLLETVLRARPITEY